MIENIWEAIEIYCGKKVDRENEVRLVDDGQGIEIDEWNVEGIREPTISELEALSDKAELLAEIDTRIKKAKLLRGELSGRDVEYDRWRRTIVKMEKEYKIEREVLING